MPLVLLSIAALVVILLLKGVPGWSVDPAPLGWMSERWLAEHRASHPH